MEEFKIGDLVYIISGGEGAAGCDGLYGAIIKYHTLPIEETSIVTHGVQNTPVVIKIIHLLEEEYWGLGKGFELKKVSLGMDLSSNSDSSAMTVWENSPVTKEQYWQYWIEMGEHNVDMKTKLYLIKEYKNTGVKRMYRTIPSELLNSSKIEEINGCNEGII